ncbi:MAG: PAS domain S-box protein [Gammaproteobacteria bacterium]|nr:MAG: PAS domain S-box protein [Gammaproteobacteria bacterium]
MSRQKSLTKTYFYSLSGLTVILTVIFGLVWMEKEISSFNKESEDIANNYILAQKSKIKYEVENVLDYIGYQRSIAEQRVKEEVKNRTTEAFHVIHHIYEQNKHKHKKEIEKLVKNALHPASWDNGSGYFFAFDTNAIETVNRNNTSLVGKSMWSFRDKKGKYVVRDMLTVVAQNGEGYVNYHWDKPSTPGKEQKKISYVKLFKPLNWVIGNGKYLEDQTKIIQEETKQRISKIVLEGDRYYFAGTYGGVSLIGPALGRNVYDVTDVNGVKIVQELIKAAQSGGGYVEYVMPKFKDEKPLPKISYSVAVPEWDWYIGSGIYIHEIDEIIAQMKLELNQKINEFILKYLIIALILILVIIAVAKFVTAKIDKNLESFFDFFYRSSDENTKIDEENINFTEFHRLARYANEMLERRIKAEVAEQKNYRQYMAIFESAIDAIMLLDPKLGFIDCNPATLQMFHLQDKKQFINVQPHQISPEYQANGSNSQTEARKYIDKALDIGACRFDWMHKRIDGEEFFANVQLIRMVIDENPIILATVRDITEYKKTQALIIQTEKMLSVGGLAAGMAHEINNPLAGMVQTAATLENRLLKLEQFETNLKVAKEHDIDIDKIKSYMHDRGIDRMVTTIRESGSRIADIVKNMLNFARSQDAQKARYLITDLVDKSLELAAIDYNQKKHYDFKDIEIVKEYAESIPEVICEPGMIQQVILNLLQNAAFEMHFAEIEHPKIIIRCWYQLDKSMVGIEIEDVGSGIPPEIKHKLFEPFFTTKTAGIGTGLGLSVSYYIISKDHDGEISEISEPGNGAKFRIMLPAVKD